MGKHWDGDKGGRDAWIAWLSEAMTQALRVCKPGAHAFVWALPRTSHWTAMALEDAGWEVRDRIAHHFGSGFPKNKDLGDGVGTALKPSTEDWWLCRKALSGSTTACHLEYGTGGINVDACRIAGTKPVMERTDTVVAAKSMSGESTGSTNTGEVTSEGRWPANVVLSHLEECEVVGTRTFKGDQRDTGNGKRPGGFADVGAESGDGEPNEPVYGDEEVVEWNCAPGCPVAELDVQSGERRSAGEYSKGNKGGANDFQGPASINIDGLSAAQYADSGGASRFFYCAKTSRGERNAGLEEFDARFAPTMGNGIGAPETATPKANVHPTVKPINLMRWLVRLVTPSGGTVLDPFLGSGSTGCAAVLEGFNFIGIEREAEYVAIAESRIAFWAQHDGRLVQDVLGLHRASQREAEDHAERGQLSITEVAA
jgi:site-specific DNA-methyltransferase (adenine-specific)